MANGADYTELYYRYLSQHVALLMFCSAALLFATYLLLLRDQHALNALLSIFRQE